MKTSSNGNMFRGTGHLCGEFTGPRWIPHTKASDAKLSCFLWSTLNKRLSKQSLGWWFETLNRAHYDVTVMLFRDECQWISIMIIQNRFKGKAWCHQSCSVPSHHLNLVYCQMDSWEWISVTFKSEFYHFDSRKFIWKCRLPKRRPFCPRGDELID